MVAGRRTNALNKGRAMMDRRAQRLGVWVVCGALYGALWGCGQPPRVKVHDEVLGVHTAQVRASEGLAPTVVMMEPFFSGDFAPYQIYQKTHGAVSHLTSAAVPVVAPWEFGGATGRSVLHVLDAEDISPDEVLLMEMRVIMLGGTARVGVVGSEETIIDVRSRQHGTVEVKLDTGAGEPVASLKVAFEQDGLAADVTAYDAHPALTGAIANAMAQVSTFLAERYHVQPVPRDPLIAEVRFDHMPMFNYAANGDPPLRQHLDKLQGVEATVGLMRYYQYFDPDIPVEELQALSQGQRGGLWVRQPGALERHGLSAGDFIVAIGGQRALGAHVLLRPLLHGHTQHLVLLVERAGQTHRIEVPLHPDGAPAARVSKPAANPPG